MDQRTLRPHEMTDAPTIRPAYVSGMDHEAATELVDQYIGEWKLLRKLDEREGCTLYLAEDAGEDEPAVVKHYHNLTQPPRTLARMQNLHHDHLMPLLEYGVHDGTVYEVYHYLPEGTLDGAVVAPDVVLNVVLPQLFAAIDTLHANGILHNDIKPSNLYWAERDKRIVLGDYDCLTFIGRQEEREIGYSVEYAAPEVVQLGQEAFSKETDYCSMGVTLVSLLQGYSPLRGKTTQQIRRAWGRGIPLPDHAPPVLKILINNLIRYEAKDRMDAEKLERWLRTNCIDAPARAAAAPGNEPAPPVITAPLRCGEYTITNITDMVRLAGENWAWGCMMLEQRRLSIFLRQYGLEQYDICRRCEAMFNKDEGLFVLLHTLTHGLDFYWFGVRYRDLQDFISRMVDTSDEDSVKKSAHFLRAGLLKKYYENLGESQMKIVRAQELAETARKNPELALSQLMASMSQTPELRWDDRIFVNLEDLIDWLTTTADDLDSQVQRLYESRRFEAWMSFIGEGKFVYELQSMMKGALE